MKKINIKQYKDHQKDIRILNKLLMNKSEDQLRKEYDDLYNTYILTECFLLTYQRRIESLSKKNEFLFSLPTREAAAIIRATFPAYKNINGLTLS